MTSTQFFNKAKLPLTLLAILLIPQFTGSFIPNEIKSVLYALSLSMKSVLEFFLPFIIFSFIFSTLSNFQKGALFFVVLLVSCVFVSNLSALMYGYGAGKLGLHLLNLQSASLNQTGELIPAWHFQLKKWVSNDFALVCGFISGVFFSIVPSQTAKKTGDILNLLANGFLKNCFIPLLPLFILGFVLKLEYENTLKASLTVYGPIIVLIVMAQWLYILNWYFVASNFNGKRFLTYLKNILPASLTGFSTISSAASMPVLLVSTEKNLGDTKKAKMVVPAVINIHTVGSAIGIPILALATIASFGLPLPSPTTFAIFALYTALAKYAVAAVPGGVVIVVAPILEAHLGFSSEMVGIVTAVYMICDPFGTTANVTANGAFPILFTRLFEKLASAKQTVFGGTKEPSLTEADNLE